MRVRRAVLVFAAMLLVTWGIGHSLRADGPITAAPPSTPSDVEVELADKSKVTGRFAPGTIRILANYGVVELDVKKVKRIEVTPPDDGETRATANVILLDKSHFSGPLLADNFTVETDAGPRDLPMKSIEGVKFLHPRDTSFLGAAVGLLTLTAMEIILGIDNVIFLAILAGKLPEEQRPRARHIGLAAALGTRLLLLFALSTLMGLTKPVFTLPPLPLVNTLEARGISWRDIVLLLGGLFLIAKSTYEMHEKVESAKAGEEAPSRSSFVRVIIMIALVDIVFSLDSVITAVGMVDEIWVMVVAMVAAMLVMLGFAGPIARFVDKHPTIKVLALSFLVLIGVILVAEGLGQHIDKGYIYFAMAFAVGVELINIRVRPRLPGKQPA